MTKELKHALFSTKYTQVFHEPEEEMNYGAPHFFRVVSVNPDPTAPMDEMFPILCDVCFQEGPIKEAGVNGVNNEDLLIMVLTRLEHFQKTEFACKENEMAIEKLVECLQWLRYRTLKRELRGVEGTHIV